MSAAGSGPDPSGPSEEEAQAQARALALLEATHSFPCAYSVTVIAFNQADVTAEVRRAVYGGADEPEDGGAHHSQESRGGKYLSHRIAVPVPDARSVLELYARLRVIEGVVTLL